MRSSNFLNWFPPKGNRDGVVNIPVNANPYCEFQTFYSPLFNRKIMGQTEGFYLILI